MAYWVKGTVTMMWLMVSVCIVVAAVATGLLGNVDVRMVIGGVTMGVMAPVWGLLTAAYVVVAVLERRRSY